MIHSNLLTLNLVWKRTENLGELSKWINFEVCRLDQREIYRRLMLTQFPEIVTAYFLNEMSLELNKIQEIVKFKTKPWDVS